MTPEFYGLSRTRDRKGNVVSRSLKPYVNCLHTLTGTCRDNMEVFVVARTRNGARIRRLTPSECFGLMGVSREDTEAITTAVKSKKQQYKLAGNSIVTDVLYYIFRQLLIRNFNGKQQLILF